MCNMYNIEELKLKNIENLKRVNSVNVEYLTGKEIPKTIRNILATLANHNKLSSLSDLGELDINVNESDSNNLEDVLNVLDINILNPNVDIIVQNELLRIAIQIRYIIAIETEEDLKNFLKCYNTPALKECIFELIENSQIQFVKDSVVDLLSNYLNDFNNCLVWELINNEQRKPIEERERVNQTQSMNVFNN